MDRRISQLVVAAMVMGCCASAGAQTTTETDLAKTHYLLGQKYYRASNYPKALAAFNEAYKLDAKPGLLFNIARCQEVMGQLKQAVANYELYLQKIPTAPNRELVKTRVKNLQVVITARQAPEPTPAPAPASQPAPTTAPAVEPRTRPALDPPAAVDRAMPWRRTTGWVALGVGGAALATGVVLGTLASGKADEHDQAVQDKQTYQQIEQIIDAGQRYETAQVATLITGGVLMAAGAGLLVWDLLDSRQDHGEAPTVSLAPVASDSYLGLVGQWSF